MITNKALEAHAKTQLFRISHLLGFPSTKEAVRDYIAALLVVGSFEGITRLMDDLSAEEWDRVPSAAVIRRMAYDRREATKKKQAKCPMCQGSGMVTEWRLVTYRGNSYVIERVERVTGDYEQSLAFAAKLPSLTEPVPPGVKRQAILSCARDCECRKSA